MGAGWVRTSRCIELLANIGIGHKIDGKPGWEAAPLCLPSFDDIVDGYRCKTRLELLVVLVLREAEASLLSSLGVLLQSTHLCTFIHDRVWSSTRARCRDIRLR